MNGYTKEAYMRKKALVFLLAVLIALLAFSLATAAMPVKLTVGKGTVLKLEKASKRVSLSNPDLAEITLISPQEILLSGKKPGSTNLIIWDVTDKATVYDIVVFGDTGALMAHIQAIAPGEDVTVETAEDSLVLRGTVRNEEAIDRIFKISQAYSPKVINFLSVGAPPQILLEVKVAQIDRSKLQDFGISGLFKGNDFEITAPGLFASPSGNVGGGAGVEVTPGIGSFDVSTLQPQIAVASYPEDIALVLRALSTKGLASILAEPNLVVRNGEKGAFLAGSRIPVQTVTGTGASATPSITYEQVGVKLNFAPQVLENGVIRLKVDPAEVSSLGRQFAFAGGLVAFEILTRQVSTNVDLKEGESLILAGMLSEEMIKNLKKIPLLGDIPILGALFRSTSDQLKKTELAFFITPRLVKPMPAGTPRPDLPGEKISDKEMRKYWWIPVPGGSETPERQGMEEGTPMGEERSMEPAPAEPAQDEPKKEGM
jgi:pilus assembly protein CpaC